MQILNSQEFDQALAAKNNLQGLSREKFIREGVKLFSSLNHIHPFREYNRLTQRMFFEKLAKSADHEIDFSIITEKCMTFVSSKAEERISQAYANYV
ncbi:MULTISPECIES: hypothetical protein [unclassified Bartonella]|uniref:hypothetical protein n=1 Tax=unclassified Bartonella TaxID=2645622 RepID=UPI00099A4681|nr:MULTISPECIES: hypothetical protein [unclassified Bartonella]AQX27887.1 cell filamentation protein [Bartonella sp. JB15]AQX29167.1 cell filamentation protein [Bartonella sp. JB63]